MKAFFQFCVLVVATVWIVYLAVRNSELSKNVATLRQQLEQAQFEAAEPLNLDLLSDGQWRKVDILGGVNFAFVYKNEGELHPVRSTLKIPSIFTIKGGHKNVDEWLVK